MVDRVKQQFGNYRLIRLLGKGGFAEVYLGEHIRLGTQAAIKILHAQIADEEMDGFHKEARTIAHLEHPNIVRVLDFDVEDGIPFLVLHYAPNGTLRQHHPRGRPLPLTTIVSYVKQIADALQYAHDEKHIHRDIKPENMLVGRRNEVLLSDFGIATIAQSSRYQSTQNMVGTVAYMAPEQIQGKPRPASDQYALAIVIYEWLSGDRPFQGSFTEVATQHVLASPPSLREKDSTISPALEYVVLTALEKDPHRRFGSVRAFANAFEQASQETFLSFAPTILAKPFHLVPQAPQSPTSVEPSPPIVETPISMTPPDLLQRELASSTPAESSPSIMETPASVTPPNLPQGEPAVVSLPPVTSLPPIPAESSPSIMEIPIQAIPLDSLEEKLPVLPNSVVTSSTQSKLPTGNVLYTNRSHSHWIFSVSWSPDNSRIASGSLDGTVQIWNPATEQRIIYSGHSGSAHWVKAVSWSPKSNHIASGGTDKRVKVWDATTKAETMIYYRHSGIVEDVAWSPDGRLIASASGDKEVHVWNVVSGQSTIIYRGHSAQVNAVAWSPDGTCIASASNDSTIHVWDIDTGKRLHIYNGHSSNVIAVAWSPDGRYIASGSQDKTVQVWDAVTGRCLHTYLDHSDEVRTVKWSSNGRYIASGSFDKMVRAWNFTDGKLVFTYTGHLAGVEALAWSSDNARIASASTDGSLHLWVAP